MNKKKKRRNFVFSFNEFPQNGSTDGKVSFSSEVDAKSFHCGVKKKKKSKTLSFYPQRKLIPPL